MSKVRVLVGVLPERGGVPTADIFFDFIAIAHRGHAFVRLPYMRTDLARNTLAEHLLNESRFTHLLMLDCDHRHPADIVERLQARVEEDPNRLVVAGLAFRRGVPFDPCMYLADADGSVYVPEQWEPGSVLKVDLVGSAALLIHRSVFEQLARPWFAYDYSHAPEGHWPGEDIWFSRRCLEAGIGVYVDTGCQSPHHIDNYVTEDTFRTHLARVRELRRATGVLTEADLDGGGAAAGGEG